MQVLYDGREMHATHFEALAGMAKKRKWRESLVTIGGKMKLGDWLQLPPARQSKHMKAVPADKIRPPKSNQPETLAANLKAKPSAKKRSVRVQ